MHKGGKWLCSTSPHCLFFLLYSRKMFFSFSFNSSPAVNLDILIKLRDSLKVKLNQIENWLSRQLTYTLQKPVYQTFQTHFEIFYPID